MLPDLDYVPRRQRAEWKLKGSFQQDSFLKNKFELKYNNGQTSRYNSITLFFALTYQK